MPVEPPNQPLPTFSRQRLRVLLMAGSMEGGGSERQTLLLLRHLDRRSIQPLLYLSHRRGPLLREVPADVKILACDSGEPTAHEQRRRGLALNWPGRRLRQQIRFLSECMIREQIDVVYDRTFHMTMLAGPAAQQTGVPHVSTIVSPPDRAFPLLEQRFRWWKKRRLVQAYRTAARVIAVSDAVADSAVAFYGLPATSVTTIRNPVDRERLLLQASQPTDWTPSADRANLICIGRMTEEKGHADLLHALAQLEEKRWQLWLLGDGPLRGSLETLSEQLGLAQRIRFLGHVDPTAAILANCQLLVLPSRFEGLPNVVLEALALGVPVIATDAGGTAELIRGGRSGRLVPAANPAALRDALAGFFQDPEAHRAQARRAQAEVSAAHRVEKLVPRIEGILREVAQKR